MNIYRDMFQAMNDADLHYLVVGGVAVNLHGYSRFTGDIDIVLALDAENLEKIALLMEEKGFTQRLPIDVRQFANHDQLSRWIAEKGLTAYTFVDPKLPQFSVDIITSESFNFEDLNKNKVSIDLDNLIVPVVSIDDLIGMKQKANRQKDIEDIAALLELKGL